MIEQLKTFGALRLLLIAAAVILAIISPEPGTTAARSGWEMVSTLVAPAMAPLVLMVLLFDFMMCRIRMSDVQDYKRFRIISFVELVTIILFLLVWLPFFLAIGNR